MQVHSGHAFLAEKGELLETALPMPEPLTSSMAGSYDLVVQVRREGVPRFLWDLVMFGAAGELDKQIQKLKKETSPEKQAELQATQIARSVTLATLTEVKSAWIGLNISQESKTAQIDLKAAVRRLRKGRDQPAEAGRGTIPAGKFRSRRCRVAPSSGSASQRTDQAGCRGNPDCS